MCHAAQWVEQWRLTGHLNFAAFFNPHHAKGQLLLMTTFNQIEIPNLKNLQLQHPIRKKPVRKRE
jgi:hypothetical protein